MGGNNAEARSSRSKRSRQFETVEEVLLPQVHQEFLLWEGCNSDAKSMYNTRLANLLPRHIYSSCVVNWDILNGMGCDGEIDDILGLYHADELEEDGFDVYFQGGLRSDEHFNAQEYWLSISREENLGLSRSHTYTIQNLILRVIHKMITYGLHQNGYANEALLIARWMNRKGAGTQKESQICCGKFITKIARKARVLTDVVLRGLSALIYCKDLDTTTLRELIDSEGRLIPEDLQPGVPRVGIPRHPRASMQDLYERMGSMKIRQQAIERMKYRQSYHWDWYQGVFEHMVGVYSVPLQGAYNPPSYAQPQYDHYYQQYPPQPPQYPQYQQQQDDDSVEMTQVVCLRVHARWHSIPLLVLGNFAVMRHADVQSDLTPSLATASIQFAPSMTQLYNFSLAHRPHLVSTHQPKSVAAESAHLYVARRLVKSAPAGLCPINQTSSRCGGAPD
ncbi:hypothetical protein Tco_1041851 [Tanacetum coccineum]|uniref:Uncharacterized protein n=1 Tax=Tanacetum coccineum TaxID=301880 RepID=A0ABQ5GHV2_9ASTR